ncbi:MAG: hypothetical protein ACFHHU_17645 [Porticoccaceae bacterium]
MKTRNRADFDVMRKMAGFIADECCSGVDLDAVPAAQAGKEPETAA